MQNLKDDSFTSLLSKNTITEENLEKDYHKSNASLPILTPGSVNVSLGMKEILTPKPKSIEQGVLADQ